MQKPVCPMCNAELSGFAWLQTKAFRITCPHCKKQISLTRRSKQRFVSGAIGALLFTFLLVVMSSTVWHYSVSAIFLAVSMMFYFQWALELSRFCRNEKMIR
ncbi:hypothetical protein ACE1TH_15390 [Shouchella sp. JSM 1781072]|uniref:hypothetical protein n=1 Tax=Bacillaceae TaxID=186817 RepID=UPI000C069FE9|nr:hypothetical protein [Bacillus sp. Marseille-P3800]